MIETALTSLATFFATIGPVEAAVLFATLTSAVPGADRRRIALRASVIAGIILLVFTLLGGPILRQLGVSIPALQTAGGVILMLIALDMVFASPASAFKLTPPEGDEARTKEDIAVFPLATPLLAGPGAMSASILLASNTNGDPWLLATVVAALVLMLTLTLLLLLGAHELNRFVSITAQRVLMRVFGILLAAIAVQAIFNGLAASGLFFRLR